MWVISQSGFQSLDLMGIDTIRTEGQDQNGNPVETFSIVGFGFGFNMNIATYGTVEEVETMVNDIHSHLYQGEQFYDIREQEKKIFK